MGSQKPSRLWRTIASSAAPTTTLESMTARCAAPTNTRFEPVRADGDAANMYAAKTDGLGLYGRQLRSANHYARKFDRQMRRANKHAFRASKGGWGHSYRGQQHQLYKAAKHDAKAQYAANMYAAKTGQF